MTYSITKPILDLKKDNDPVSSTLLRHPDSPINQRLDQNTKQPLNYSLGFT